MTIPTGHGSFAPVAQNDVNILPMKLLLLAYAFSCIASAQGTPAKVMLDSVAKIVAMGQKGALCSAEQSRLEKGQRDEQIRHEQLLAKQRDLVSQFQSIQAHYTQSKDPKEYPAYRNSGQQVAEMETTVKAHDKLLQTLQSQITLQAGCVKQAADNIDAVLQASALPPKSTK